MISLGDSLRWTARCKVKSGGLGMAERVLIIAEAGVNHNGNLEMALRLVDAAAEAGADMVKFQTFKADSLVSKTAQKAEYQKAASGSQETQYEMLKKLELSDADHHAIMDRCAERGILFLSTAFDPNGVRYLDALGLPIVKVPAGEITNLPYLRAVAACRKPVLLSTGMSTLDEVAAAVAAIGDVPITLLHCTTEYPCPFGAVNLRAMLSLKERFGLPVGYSDHTCGIEVAVAAVAMGASVIEKHFTLDRTLPGPDHRASIEPAGLAAMVAAIRNVEVALGDGVKRPAEVEMKNIPVVRKSIVARKAIRKGETFTEDNLTTMRPGTGLSPMCWDSVIGRTAKSDYEAGAQIIADTLGDSAEGAAGGWR